MRQVSHEYSRECLASEFACNSIYGGTWVKISRVHLAGVPKVPGVYERERGLVHIRSARVRVEVVSRLALINENPLRIGGRGARLRRVFRRECIYPSKLGPPWESGWTICCYVTAS